MNGYSEGGWAPVVLLTLIHLHVYPKPLHVSESTDAAVLTLLRGELITHCQPSVTARGRAHLRMLCQMPYPDYLLGGWVMPLRGGFVEIRP